MNEPRTSHTQRQTETSSETRPRLLARKEGQILLTGCGLTVLYLLWLGVQGFQSFQQVRFLVGMTATNVVFGRAAGMSFGYMGNMSMIMVLLVNMWVETILVLIFYPLFVLSWEHLVEIQILKKFMIHTREVAETHQPIIRKYGIIGLFIFVWLPFWMTGPLVGCVIGFLINLPSWTNIVIVLSGTWLATAGWAILLREVYEWAEAYSLYAPLLILGAIILVVLLGQFIGRWRQKSQQHGDRQQTIEKKKQQEGY